MCRAVKEVKQSGILSRFAVVYVNAVWLSVQYSKGVQGFRSIWVAVVQCGEMC